MYKINYGDESGTIINKFVYGYVNSYINLYKDSGLENELEILESYDLVGKKLKKEIREEIKSNLQEEIIGYRLYENGEKSIKIFLKSFILEVYFEEDEKEKIRFVEKIKINKK